MTKLLCVAMLIGVQSISLPGQSRHTSEPAVNLGDTSFLDGPRFARYCRRCLRYSTFFDAHRLFLAAKSA
jgi:hypothetical protein